MKVTLNDDFYSVYSFMDNKGYKRSLTLNLSNISDESCLWIFFSNIQINTCSDANLKSRQYTGIFGDQQIQLEIEGTGQMPVLLFVLLHGRPMVTQDYPLEIIRIPVFAE